MSDRNNEPKAVENYTHAFFVVLGVLLFMIFWTIAAVAGHIWVAVTAWIVDRVGQFIFRRLR